MISVEKRFFTWADGVLIAALLLGSGAFFWWGAKASGTGGGYRISVLGHPERARSFPRPPAGKVEIVGLLGPSEIEWDERGRVRIARSPCPNRICLALGWVEGSRSVCCVPNGVVVECLQPDRTFDGETR